MSENVNSNQAIGQYSQDLVKKLVSPETPEDLKSAKIIIGFSWPFETGLRETLVEVIKKEPDDETILKVFPMFANRFGLEETKQFLSKYADSHDEFKPLLVHVNNVLGFDKSSTLATIETTYKNIEESFVEYKPNEELLEHEIKLLKNIFKKSASLLDIGCGPAARHMNALQLEGIKNVKGIDVVPSNVSRALKDNSSLNITIADWHKLPFDDESFNGVYCLGRSMLHNTTIEDWLQTLREMNRVLKDESAGKAIIDIPRLEKGTYKKESKEFSDKSRSLGIHEHEIGDIHDSPDQENFLDRLVPSSEQFYIMAKVCGFNAHIISNKPYDNDSNINIYWELTKTGHPMSYQEYTMMYGNELTTKPTIDIDISRFTNKLIKKSKTSRDNVNKMP